MTLLNCKKKKNHMHSFSSTLEVSLASWLYAHSIWSLQFSIGPTDFFLLFQVLAKRLSKPELEKWAAVSWGIWNASSKFYFEKIQAIPKPFWTGLLFSRMNTKTLWLHKGILDTQCWVLLLRAMGYCCFFPLHWVAAGFLHWIAAACNVWAAVFLFCTDFPLGTGFSWQHWF